MTKKSNAKDQNDIKSIERRIVTRTARYTINEKTATEKIIKECNNETIQIKMKKGNNLRVYCSAVAFE